MLRYVDSGGRYVRYLPSLPNSLMYHLHLKKSDVFFNRIRVNDRAVSNPIHTADATKLFCRVASAVCT